MFEGDHQPEYQQKRHHLERIRWMLSDVRRECERLERNLRRQNPTPDGVFLEKRLDNKPEI